MARRGARGRTRRRGAALLVAAALLAVGGCGDARERADKLQAALEKVDGVERVETRTPSGMFVSYPSATVILADPLDRAAYDRVASAFHEFLETDDAGAFSSPAEADVESPLGSATLGPTPADATRIGTQIDAVRAAAPDATAWMITDDRRSEITVEAPAARAPFEELAADGGALHRAVGDTASSVTVTEDGLSLTSAVGRPPTSTVLDTLEQAPTTASGSGTGLDVEEITLHDSERVSIALTGDASPAQLLDTHDDLAELLCDDLSPETTLGTSDLTGCGSTEGLHTLLRELDHADPTSISADVDSVGRTGGGRVDLPDLDALDAVASSAPTTTGRLTLVVPRQGTEGIATVGGTGAEIARRAPLAAAAARHGVAVEAGSAFSDQPELVLRVDQDTRMAPDPLFRSLREVGWEGDLSIGLEQERFTPGAPRVRWVSTDTGPHRDPGPLRGSSDNATMGDTTRTLLDAWDASAH